MQSSCKSLSSSFLALKRDYAMRHSRSFSFSNRSKSSAQMRNSWKARLLGWTILKREPQIRRTPRFKLNQTFLPLISDLSQTRTKNLFLIAPRSKSDSLWHHRLLTYLWHRLLQQQISIKSRMSNSRSVGVKKTRNHKHRAWLKTL